MTKEDFILGTEPFSDEIGVLLELPTGHLIKVLGLHYRNIGGEGFAVLKAAFPASGGSEHG
jgi:hypothetical protein